MYSIMHLLTEEEGKLAVAAARAYMEAAVPHTEAKPFDLKKSNKCWRLFSYSIRI